MKIFISLIIISSSFFHALSQEIKYNEISDILGNRYSIKQSKLKKYSADSSVSFSYDNFNLGNISFVDVSNPYKVLLFYKNFNTVIILDDKLSKLDSRNFNFTVNNICWNYDGNFLIYHYNTGFFYIFDPITKKIISSKPFSTQNIPELLFEQNNKIILVSKNEIYILNIFFNIQKIIKESAKSYSILKGEIFLYDCSKKRIMTD